MLSREAKQKIADAYAITYQTNLQYPLPDDTLLRFVEMHNEDSLEDVLLALDYYQSNPRVGTNGNLLPVHPCHVKEKIDPRCSVEGRLAYELRTLHAARLKFGRDRGAEAQRFLSKLCFDAVMTHGNWAKCVNISGDAEERYMTSIKYTLRDLIASARMGKPTEPSREELQLDMPREADLRQLYAKDAVRDDNAEGPATDIGRKSIAEILEKLSKIGS